MERDAGGNSSSVISAFAATLVGKINTGALGPVNEWLASVNISDPEGSSLKWARDANGLICDYVLKEDVRGKELNGSYYEGARPIVERQIAKGGVRLAAWVNALAGLAKPHLMEMGVGAGEGGEGRQELKV